MNPFTKGHGLYFKDSKKSYFIIIDELVININFNINANQIVAISLLRNKKEFDG